MISSWKSSHITILKISLKIYGGALSLLSVLLSITKLEDYNICTLCQKISLFISLYLLSLILSILWATILCKKKKIGNNVYAEYNDIIKLGFKNDRKRKIVVIPVNDTFETIVDEEQESIQYPLVSSQTLHGAFLKEFTKNKYDLRDLNKRIEKNLKNNGFIMLKKYERNKRPRGNLKSYDFGTVAIIEQGNTVFYLLVISNFDAYNTANTSLFNLDKSITGLLDFYNKHGHGLPMYIPIFGTGRSNAGLTHSEAFDLMKHRVLSPINKNRKDIHIVVYKGDRDKVSILQ